MIFLLPFSLGFIFLIKTIIKNIAEIMITPAKIPTDFLLVVILSVFGALVNF
jgi:hypothetical protein